VCIVRTLPVPSQYVTIMTSYSNGSNVLSDPYMDSVLTREPHKIITSLATD